jgi:hypothetical protein
MNLRHRRGAFTDSGSDALNGTAPHIPDREDTLAARLQGKSQVSAGYHETLVVQCDPLIEPARVWIGANKQE